MSPTAQAERNKASEFRWPPQGVTRAPYRLFTDPEIYKLEQERIFRGKTWNFLCLDIEIQNAGDYRTTTVGETPVVVTRDRDGKVHAMVNRCAHKGALVCLKKKDNVASLSCVYHAWNYELDGKLKGVAFRNGVRGQGGMPEDFDPAQHRLRPLRVESFCGMIFGTFADEIEDVEAYLGPEMASFIKRNLGRPLRILGTHSQMIHNNWKLYAENLRDSYHATLLHTFYTTFKVNRLDMDGGITLSERKWHHLSFARRTKMQEAAEYADAKVHSANYESALDGPGLLEAWEEFDDGITHSIQTVFPNMCIQFTLNSLAIRFFAPRGVDQTELFWIYLGYERDTDEQSSMRVMQSNLTGAAGLVSLEDGCINEFVQRGTRADPDQSSFIEMGGREVESERNSRATETAVRGFWHGYRHIMGF
ncbi:MULTISPECIES: Rieske 2Fe-2S domain-containing protein [unclassified Bradyrhizobium]|uniref:Rieske 2Fe-2S domain-containing protein n=1 Tax=unclassified Bradyrhizobium TaxID=2631580 RepID=UPI001FF54B8F|nr:MULTISPECIES: Rieske 2Fe-2S domain-containing protein [unclassified Bradyrhizobium]MCJ9699896.1 Rieske 2Fe-2S domain-containing protein [Bradyrhizobium sp. SHOUNA76]MCJ9728868.1 Rieske 2Fe-2S domain-containing protein [Bradyrhizobium sp. PRIMUS42]